MVDRKKSGKFELKNGKQVRRMIMLKNQKKIQQMYKDLSKDINRSLRKDKNIGKRDKAELMSIRRSLNKELKKIDKSIKMSVESGMKDTSTAIVKDARTFLNKIGFREFDSKNAFSNVPHEVVRNVLTGNVYNGGKLSKNIWGNSKKTMDDINKIIASGIAMNRDIYDIAKDLEKYVNPSVRKDYKWNKMYPGTNKVVDYNAQRLARTLVSHAYQQSFKNVCDNNPFVLAYRWLTADIHGRTCEICRHRAYDDHHGLGAGVYPKNELPVDHPNGFCDFEAVIPYSLRDMEEQVFEWYNSPKGTFPELDEYAEQLRRLESMR